ncbi:hypothetical protein PanWU01x14_164330 [Parasponia andersonii]|uniref:Uncharacterized protein n=1 Tax=Parasponia andersonii TaxID=3476 RepID=A0A2P5CCF0_PARAD|nr:hypothetical protein PanWU01x14_164330 [Parasponia andersonii]
MVKTKDFHNTIPQLLHPEAEKFTNKETGEGGITQEIQAASTNWSQRLEATLQCTKKVSLAI